MTGPQIRTLPKYAETIRNRNHLKLWNHAMTARVEVWESFLNISESDSFGETEFEHTLAKKKVAYMSDLRTLLGQTDMIRVRKWKSYRPHSTMILFHVSWIRLIASTLILKSVWSYSHLSCSKSWLDEDQVRPGPHPVKRTSFSAESEALQGFGYAASAEQFKVRHGSLCCKDLQSLFTRVFCCKAHSMNNSKQNTTMHKTITPLAATTGHVKIGKSLAPWSVTSITSICNFPAMLGKAQ